MAVVVDVLREARERFTLWVSEYVSIPPQYLVSGVVRGNRVDEIVRFLVDNKVFTKAEIELIAARRGFSGVIALERIKGV